MLFSQGPYEALTKHFREQRGFKTANKERNDALFYGKNGCTQKVNSFVNFRYHLSVCEEKGYFSKGTLTTILNYNIR
jgi:hypothetical protein